MTTAHRPLHYHLALLIGSAVVLAITLYAARPRCTCVLGGAFDYGDAGYSDPADCDLHGDEMFAAENE